MGVFQDRFKQALQRSGMSQSELSRRTGIPKGRVSDYVSGRYTPKQDTVYTIAKILLVNPAWLLGFGDDPSADLQFMQINVSFKEAQLLTEYREMNAQCKTVVQDLFESLKKIKDLA